MVLVNKELVEGCKCENVIIGHIKYYEDDIIPEMIKIMNRGVGLAAPQVGINKRFFIMKYNEDIITCYNPEITFTSKQKKALEEGCLTYPQNIHGTVNIMRPISIGVKFTNKNGIYVVRKLRGLPAKVFQHELDHLNGITIFYRGES